MTALSSSSTIIDRKGTLAAMDISHNFDETHNFDDVEIHPFEDDEFEMHRGATEDDVFDFEDPDSVEPQFFNQGGQGMQGQPR